MALVLLVAIVAAQGPGVYIVTLDSQGNSYYLKSMGDGTLDTPKTVGHLATEFNWGTGIGNFTTNDEYYDFVVGTVNGDSKEIYLYKLTNPGNDFQGPDPIGTWSYGDYPADMPVANFHGKVFDVGSLDDFVMVQYPSQHVGLYQIDDNGDFAPSMIKDAAPPSPVGADAADINHDGLADFVVAPSSLGSPPYKIYVNLRNADGTFTTRSFATADNLPYWGITAADFDGDKKVDLIATIADNDIGATGFDFYQGDGQGGFTFIKRFGEDLLLSPRASVDNYDLDDDGDQDLVASNLLNNPGYVIVGQNEDFGQVDGKFTFTTMPVSAAGLAAIAAPPVFQNEAPFAVVTVRDLDRDTTINPDVQRIKAGTTLEFSNISSYDPEEKLMAFSWGFEDGNSIVLTAGENVTHQFNTPGPWDVNLTLTDNYGATTTITVTIHVNYPPDATNDLYTTDVNTPLTINAASGVLTNDKDADEDTLTATLDTDPSHGTLALNTEDGSFTYTPDKDFTGTDSFKYKANDGVEDSNVATVTITVNAHPAWKVNIVPDMINLNSRGVFIAFITLPKPYNVNDVQKDTVVCEGAHAIRINGVPAIHMIRHTKFPQVFGAVFRTADLQNVKVGNKVTLTVTGQVEFNGNTVDFSGSDTVRVFTLKNRIRDDTDDFERMSDKQLFEKFPGYRGDGQDRDSPGHDDRDQDNGH
jgi:VCBS repeat-containing protein